MGEVPVTTKTRDEILNADIKDLTWDEKAIQTLLEFYPDWTLETAIEYKDIVP